MSKFVLQIDVRLRAQEVDGLEDRAATFYHVECNPSWAGEATEYLRTVIDGAAIEAHLRPWLSSAIDQVLLRLAHEQPELPFP